MSKGSRQRPVDRKKFNENYERIFGGESVAHDETVNIYTRYTNKVDRALEDMKARECDSRTNSSTMTGRPSKYTPELVAKAKKYLDGGFKEDGYSVIPSIEVLSLYLSIHRSTCHDWAGQEGKEDFSDILEQILAKQASMAINRAPDNTYNATIAKLLLGKHGYKDRQETETTHDIGKNAQRALGKTEIAARLLGILESAANGGGD